MKNKRIIIYDIETSGLSKVVNQPIEVACKIIDKDGCVSHYHSYIKNKYPLHPIIVNLTGITDSILLDKGRPVDIVMGELYDLFMKEPDTLFVGHNILRFDNSFLSYHLQIYGFRYVIEAKNSFDTAAAFKIALNGYKNNNGLCIGDFHNSALSKKHNGMGYKLIDACRYYEISNNGSYHNAMDDVNNAYEVFLKQYEC